MLVYEVMSTPVITLRWDDTVRHAIRVLYHNTITAAPVLGDHGELAGIVSEIDLLCGEFQPDPRVGGHRPVPDETPPRRVADVMSRRVVTVGETTDVTVLIDLMVVKRIKSVPVLNADRVVGMVSRRDLLAMLAHSDAALREAVINALHERYPCGPSWQVTVRDGVVELHGHAGHPADQIAELVARTVPGVVAVRHV